MFGMVYKKRILCGLRSRELMFWTLLFPMALATLFYFALSRLDEDGALEAIPTGVVTDENWDAEGMLPQVIGMLSRESDALLEVTEYSDEERASQALDDGKIDGYIMLKEQKPVLALKRDGMNQTILKSFLEQYIQKENAVRQAMEAGGKKELSLSGLFDTKTITEKVSLTKNAPSETVTYYYALLGMLCMYGGFQGVMTISGLQANMSAVGLRRSLAPVQKGTVILADLLGGYTMHLCCVWMVLLYIQFVLKINFGSNLLLAAAACACGCLAGVSMGALIALPVRWKEGMKTGMVVTISMICSFLSGLMIYGVNYEVERSAPLLAWINPAARVTDMFYSLYYYEDLKIYFRNMGILLVLAAVFLMIMAAAVRRQQYESI